MRMFQNMVVTRFAMEVATSIATGLAGIIVSVGAMDFGIGWDDAGPEPGYFPFYIGLLILLGSLGNLVRAFTHHRSDPEIFLDAETAGRVVSFLGPILLFLLLTVGLGLYVATALYLAGVMRLQGRYPLCLSALVALGASTAFYLVFEIWFQVPLLKGPVEALLGIY
jgi:hypothetical protein